ncbi:MAG: zinc finger domain-containing protein [Gaiellaceae bacterium]
MAGLVEVPWAKRRADVYPSADKSRWRVEPRGTARTGRPWLVLRGGEHEAVLWNGPVLEIGTRPRLGPDVLTGDLAAVRLRGPIGEALLDQRQVSGIGNLWRAEALWHAGVSPWARAEDVDQQAILSHARRLMMAPESASHFLGAPRESARRAPRAVYRRAGRPCPRCGMPIRSRGQGDDNRTAYWCPGCQGGGEPPGK